LAGFWPEIPDLLWTISRKQLSGQKRSDQPSIKERKVVLLLFLYLFLKEISFRASGLITCGTTWTRNPSKKCRRDRKVPKNDPAWAPEPRDDRNVELTRQ
jgi:hypothetical protein